MSVSKGLLLVIVTFMGVAVLGAGCAGCAVYKSYHTAIRFDEDVKKAWSDIDVALERRYDLIPNFVETVKGAAEHERETFQDVVAARNGLLTARDEAVSAGGPQAAALAAQRVKKAMGSFINVVNERYPNLKATETFRELMVQLEGSENRIGEKRKRYNSRVRSLNSHIRGVIGSIAAGWADVDQAEYFESAEEAREVPKVEF